MASKETRYFWFKKRSKSFLPRKKFRNCDHEDKCLWQPSQDAVHDIICDRVVVLHIHMGPRLTFPMCWHAFVRVRLVTWWCENSMNLRSKNHKKRIKLAQKHITYDWNFRSLQKERCRYHSNFWFWSKETNRRLINCLAITADNTANTAMNVTFQAHYGYGKTACILSNMK